MPKKLNIKIDIKKDEFRRKLDIKDGYTPIKGKDYFDGKDAIVDEENIALEASKLVRGTVTIVSSFNKAPKNAKIGDILMVEDSGETYIYQ